ncbi:MAG: glycosyltransferase [Clostridia bacterium]|nr:glycosyltransferase [Clostridia bacterium]
MVKKIKVLHIIPTLTIGGAERQLLSLVSGYDKEKFEMKVFCTTSGGALHKEFIAAGQEPVIFDKCSKADLKFFIRLIKAIKRYKPDIVHTWLDTANIWGGLAAFIAGVKVIISSERSDGNKSRLFAFITKTLSNIFTLVICNSRSAQDTLHKKIGIPAKKLTTVYNGIDTSRIPPIQSIRQSSRDTRSEYGIEQDDLLIGMACRIDVAKDLETFAKIAEKLTGTYYSFKMLIIGDALFPEEKTYKEQIIKLLDDKGLRDRIIITGFKNDISKEIGMLDIYIHTSIREGLSNSIAEAMLLEKPIIATDAGGNAELIEDKVCGIIVKTGDEQGFTDGILRLVSDKELAFGYAVKAREKILRAFSKEVMVDNMQNIYLTIKDRGK